MFSFDITATSATIEVYPTGKYPTVVLSDPKAYKQDGTAKKDNPEESWPDKEGVRYTLRIADGEYKGKPLMYSPDFNNEYGAQQAKGFLMACLGYKVNREGEDKFNADMIEKFGSKEALVEASKIDPATGEVGELWKLVKGKNVIVDLDVNISGDKTYQKIKSFIPVE